MDYQTILAIGIVAVAAVLLVRRYLGGKKAKAPGCANCECGEKAGAGDHGQRQGTDGR